MTGTIGEGPDGEKRRAVPYLGALKAAVGIMGVLIVVGGAVIGVTIAMRLSGSGEDGVSTGTAISPRTAISAAPVAFADRDIAIPEGAAVVDTTLNGRRLAVSLRLRDGRSAVLLVDADTGARLGLLTLTPSP